jgi:complement component 1 Q subcomponent-binding protein
MWRRGLFTAVAALRHTAPSGVRGAATVSSAVNSMILRSLKDHYMDVAKMNMPPVLSLSPSISLC